MILYEDRDIIVCHKPAGIAVQSARLGEKDLVSMLNNHLAEQAGSERKSGDSAAKKRTARGGTPMEPIRVVHRLDQPVEGVLVFAKTKKAAAGLSKQVTDGTMKKTYQAVCCVTEKGRSWLEEAGGLQWHALTDYLVKDARTNTSSVTEKGKKDAKEARLSFRIVAQCGALALAEIRLDTGRHHQIRVQMAHAGLPLYGDVKYNANWAQYVPEYTGENGVSSDSPEKSDTGREKEVENRSSCKAARPEPALCAVRLEFIHPVNGKKMKFETEPGREIFGLF